MVYKFLVKDESPYKTALDAAGAELSGLLRQRDEIEKRIAQLKQTIITLSALSEPMKEPYPADDDDDTIYIPSAFDRAARQAALAVTQLVHGRRAIGFSDLVREILKASGEPMSAVDVRAGIINMGIDVDAKYTNALAVIHTTLRRLFDGGEVTRDVDPVKGNLYQWKTYQARSLPNQGEVGVNPIGPLKPTRGPQAFERSPLKHIGKRGRASGTDKKD